MTRRTTLVLFVLLAGCTGDPDLDGSDATIRLQLEEVERSRCEAAPPGCEGVDIAAVTLYSCEGEPLLGALVDRDGGVLCVDAMSVLIEELRLVTEPLADDPSPQPSHPGAASREPTGGSADEEPSVASSSTSAEPLLTPIAHADPTPTPVIEPVLRDPTPTPIVQPEPDEEDPTPTPTMEQ